MTTIELQQMSGEALIAETKRVAEVERRSMAALLTLLIEVERRRLHLALGHSSLFVYCLRVLHFSEQAAYSRVTAARAACRFPVLLDSLAEGALTLSSVGLLAPHLTDENVEPMLEAARHKSTRDVERLIAALHPRPDIATSVRAVPTRRPGPPSDQSEGQAPPLLAGDGPVDQAPPPTAAPAVSAAPDIRAPARPVLAPLAPNRFLLKVTLDQETHDKLERARALLRHSIPEGDLATILGRALTLLVRDAERTKFAATERPRAAAARATRGRRIPAAIRRAVWTRDGGRCAFVGPDGRCNETGFLEFHHVIPFGAGGPTDAVNLELRCRAHNAYEAEVHDTGAPTRRAPS